MNKERVISIIYNIEDFYEDSTTRNTEFLEQCVNEFNNSKIDAKFEFVEVDGHKTITTDTITGNADINYRNGTIKYRCKINSDLVIANRLVNLLKNENKKFEKFIYTVTVRILD